MNDFLKNIFVWLVLGSIIFLVFNNVEPTAPRETISYSQFKQEVLSDRVSEVTYKGDQMTICLLYTSPSPRDDATSRMPSSA